MKVIHQKRDPFAGKTWIAGHYLAKLKSGDTLRVIHKGKFAGEMLITPDDITVLESNKSKQTFQDKYTGGTYHLYGMWWRPRDKDGNIIRIGKKKKTKAELAVEKQSSLFNS